MGKNQNSISKKFAVLILFISFAFSFQNCSESSFKISSKLYQGDEDSLDLPSPTPFLSPSPSVSPSPTVSPATTPSPSPTLVPSPTPSPTLIPSPTPTPTFVPSPTPTPTPTPIADFEDSVSDCTDISLVGWKCLSTSLQSSEGFSYRIGLRWNRIKKISNGTVIFVKGGNGNGFFRDFNSEGKSIQDELNSLDGIRSIDVDFQDLKPAGTEGGGYWAHPHGYRSAALAYMAVLDFLHEKGLKKGGFLNHVGGSNGTMIAAYALSHFNAEKYINRAIFHAGPFIPDFIKSCDSNYWAGFNKSPEISEMLNNFMSDWMVGNRNNPPCSLNITDRNSVLTHGKKVFLNTAFHVEMGAKEVGAGFGNWILNSNLDWFSQIVSPEKNRVLNPNIGHEMSWGNIRKYAKLSPPTPLQLTNPKMIYSLTKDGPETHELPVDRVVYGVAYGMPQIGAMACSELASTDECLNPNKWTPMPNTDWKFEGGVWRSEFVISSTYFKPGQSVKGFWINSVTGERTPLITVQLRAP